MMRKKDLPALLLAAILSMGYVSASEKPQQKIKFSLKPSAHHIMKNYESHYFSLLQERMRKTGKDYSIVQAPGDNMLIIVPNLERYSMPIIKPGPEWYDDDKFVIKLGPEWSFSKEWLFKELYKSNKRPQGILLYEWKHK